MIEDPLGAFCAHNPAELEGSGAGPLVGLSLGVKDLFDLKGYRTGSGNPDWFRTHPPAEATAPAVQALLDAGADIVGKTQTDELAFSLNGENDHYGTPVNPACPDRIPGGSSSGSASAVAGGLVDIGLGTDTGGSVRAPASYCGIWGFRPTHGAISLDGVTPLAPSFDTVGWFARQADPLARVGEVLLPAGTPQPPTRLYFGEDAFEAAMAEAVGPLRAAAERVADSLGLALRMQTIADDGLDLWLHHFQALQWSEIWATHGAWIEAEKPRFGPAIEARFEGAAAMPAERVEVAAAFRKGVIERTAGWLTPGCLLLVPSAPTRAPLKGLPVDQVTDYRNRALRILCIAGLNKLPQLSMPLIDIEGCPLGLSVIGPRGSDRALLDIGVRIAGAE